MSAEWCLRIVTRREAGNVLSLELDDPSGAPLPAFEAGAHITVETAPKVWRQYSLYNDPAQRQRYSIAVLVTRHSRGGGIWLREHARPGMLLKARAPQNAFPLRQPAGPVMLLAGGIGITPLLAMARVCHQRGVECAFHYTGRPETLEVFTPLWQTEKLPALQQHEALPERWPDAVGRDWYLCGSDRFMTHARQRLLASGAQTQRIYQEVFTVEQREGDKGFWVEIVGRDAPVWVAPDQTMADALLAVGCDVALSCCAGACGSCGMALAGGVADHRDSYLSEAQRQAQNWILPCCSRALSDTLVIDPDG